MRAFFYNRLTEEGTYEEPPEWRLALGDDGGGPRQGGVATAHSVDTASWPALTMDRGGGASVTSAGHWTSVYDETAGIEYYLNEVPPPPSFGFHLSAAAARAAGGVECAKREAWLQTEPPCAPPIPFPRNCR